MPTSREALQRRAQSQGLSLTACGWCGNCVCSRSAPYRAIVKVTRGSPAHVQMCASSGHLSSVRAQGVVDAVFSGVRLHSTGPGRLCTVAS